MGDELWVVQYLRAGTNGAGRRLPAERPRIYRVAAFSGDTVWGVNVDTRVLTKVNRDAVDGSGRAMNMQAFPDVGAARRVAEKIAAEMDAADAAAEAEAAAAAAAREAERRAKYPAVLPVEPGAEEPGAGDGDTGSDVQVGISYTVKPAKPAGPAAGQGDGEP